MSQWVIYFALSTALASAAFVVVAVQWLKKLRVTLAVALGETAHQQIRTAQRLGESMAQLQRQQTEQEKQLLALIESNARLRRDLNALEGKLDTSQELFTTVSTTRVLH
ncbi:MAG: hypothetical protein AB7E52_08555 [Bdellovibrionales bacterium]